ncbi:MAG: acylphosphatase, partial [Bacteroidia bacterium]
MKRISLLIKGKVQGVFYRKSAAAKANEIGLSGFVKNMH